MKLKIVADSKHPENTKFVDVETGNELVGIAHAEIIIQPFDIKAILILDDFELEANTDAVLDENP